MEHFGQRSYIIFSSFLLDHSGCDIENRLNDSNIEAELGGIVIIQARDDGALNKVIVKKMWKAEILDIFRPSTRFSKILNVRLQRDESKVVGLSNWK